LRCYPKEDGQLYLKPGDYGKDEDGKWWVRPPIEGPHAGVLIDHSIVEHEDASITVSPSILIEGVYHGYLKKGTWYPC
jgi:hypothetical protein